MGYTIAVTGGTGSFGYAFVRYMAPNPAIEAIRIISRGEMSQVVMAQQLAQDFPSLPRKFRFIIADVRDHDRMRQAVSGCQAVVHAAALKHVRTGEYNPSEVARTNIDGTRAVADACVEAGVEKAILLSSDKACHPANLYGATKLVAERIWAGNNHFTGRTGTRLSVVRYGNVLGSNGSVVPKLRGMWKSQGVVTVTDPSMTRFWIVMSDAIRLVHLAFERMLGGEVFVPILNSMAMGEFIAALLPESAGHWTVVGRQMGEKMHETLVTAEETSGACVKLPGMWVLDPFGRALRDNWATASGGWKSVTKLRDEALSFQRGVDITSQNAPRLTPDDLGEMLRMEGLA